MLFMDHVHHANPPPPFFRSISPQSQPQPCNQPTYPQVEDFLLKGRTCAYIQKYQPAYSFTLYDTPPPCEKNTHLRTIRGVASATFGTTELGGSLFSWSFQPH